MIEILSIVLSILSLVIFLNFPLNFYFFKKKYLNLKLGYADSLLLNLIIGINILLLFSFFKINLNYLFLIATTLSLSLIIINYKNFLFLFKKNITTSLVFFVFIYSMSTVIAKTSFLEWDGMEHWIFKAQVYFQGGEYKDLKNVPQNYYPHLGSYIWAFFWKNSYLQYEYFGRIFFIFIFVTSIFSLISKLSSKFSLIEKLSVLFIIGFLSTNFYLFGGYQEYLIFFSFFCYSYFMLYFSENIYLFKKSFIPEFLIILILSILLWTKQEGFFYFILLSFVFLLHGKRNFNQKFLFLLISLSFLLIFIFIKIYYFGYLSFNEKIINNEILNNLNLFHLFEKIFLITKNFLITFIKYPIWLVIILSFFILRYKSNFLNLNKFFYTFLFLSFSLVFAIFFHTTMDLKFLVPITLNRIVFAISGFYIILVITALNAIKK
jgi:hypothetical protein